MALDKALALYFQSLHGTLEQVNQCDILKIVDMVSHCYQNNGTIYVFGNGGSGATASHFCGDLLRIVPNLKDRLKAVCLNDNIPAMMAVANDIAYEEIFKELLINFLQENDLVLALTGSGNSQNILNALHYAKQKNVKSIVCCGFDGGKAKKLADHVFHVPIHDMEIVEDIHMMTMHAIKRLLINSL